MYRETGRVRTDLYCHGCTRDFIALIDYDLDGCHVIDCPWCGHKHYRVIKDGVVTDDRFDSDASMVMVESRDVVKSGNGQISSMSRSHFLRDRWLNH